MLASPHSVPGRDGRLLSPVSLAGLCVSERFLPLEPSAFLLSLLWPLLCIDFTVCDTERGCLPTKRQVSTPQPP